MITLLGPPRKSCRRAIHRLDPARVPQPRSRPRRKARPLFRVPSRTDARTKQTISGTTPEWIPTADEPRTSSPDARRHIAGIHGRRFHNGTPCSAMKQSERGFGPISTILPARLKLAISLQCSWSPMGWMDLNEYALIEGAAKDRLLDLLQAVVPRRVKAAGAPTSTLATVLSVSSALRVQPRAIDRCTDYLGDRVLHERQRRQGAIDPAGYPTGEPKRDSTFLVICSICGSLPASP